MRLFTYQKKGAVERLLKEGILKIDDKKYMDTYNSFKQDTYNSAEYPYQYIMNRMDQNLPKREKDIVAPIWAWVRRGTKRQKFYPADLWFEGEYRIVFDIPDELVLLSDFANYEYLLVSWQAFILIDLLHYSDEAYDNWWKEYRSGLHKKEDYYEYCDKVILDKDIIRKSKYVQATFWELKKEYIVDIKYIKKTKKKRLRLFN